MLSDIKLENNESLNIERFTFLINAQRVMYFDKVYQPEIQKETPDLEKLINNAVEKSQWRLGLLLLTSPCILSKEFIQQLAQHKHSIISETSLIATNDYGQYVLSSNSLADIDNKATNLSRLAYFKSGYLPARKFGYFTNQPIGALGKISTEMKRRLEEKDDKVRVKNSRVAENIIRCASIDAATGTVLGRLALNIFRPLLTNYLKNPSCHQSAYNPLLLLSEVVMLLMDKGYNQPLGKKDKIEQFYALKIFLDSPKIPQKDIGYYKHKYGVHIKIHSDKIDFLETIFHELTHALCKIIYNRTDSIYRTELQKLALALRKYHTDHLHLPSTLNFFSVYSEEQYAEELFPRMVQLYIQDPYNPFATRYPYEILAMANQLFSQFFRDLSEFKAKLILLQTENKWSRVATSKAIEDKDYKSYFSMVAPTLQSSMNEWPQFSKDSKLVAMALDNGFSFYSVNKFKKNVLQMVLEDKHPDLDRGLDILEKIWEAKGRIPPANLDVRDSSGCTLLITAIIQKRNSEFIKWLIVDAGVDLSIEGYKYSAADYAKLRGLEEIHKLIEQFMNPGGPDLP